MNWPTEQDILETFRTVHDMGGLVVANHLPWNKWTFDSDAYTFEELKRYGSDIFELVNGRTFDFTLLNKDLDLLLGSDMHSPEERNHGVNVFQVKDFSYDAIWDVLKNHRDKIDIVFSASGEKGWDESEGDIPWYGKLVKPMYYLSKVYMKKTFVDSDEGAYSFVNGFCKPVKLRIEWLTILFSSIWFCTFVMIWYGVSYVLQNFSKEKVLNFSIPRHKEC